MKAAFLWGALFGCAIGVILLGHHGILTDPTDCARHVSPRFSFSSGGCERDWPSYAVVCQDIDEQGNRIIRTGF